MRTAIRWLPLLVLLALPLPALAAPADKEGVKESTYDIEVLVFEQRLPDLLGEELLAKDAATLRLRGIENVVPPDTATAPGEPYLRPAVSEVLERDGHYRVLAYAHWLQTVEANAKGVKPVRLAPTNPANPNELEGAVRFSMSRYLHLDVNLLFREAGSDPAVPTLYRISEQRRIKSQETQYFDHPKFGALVRVMPVEPGTRGEGQGAK